MDKLFTLPYKTPRIPYQVGKHLYTHVAQCIAAISYKSRNLLGTVDDFECLKDQDRVTSETELRYSVYNRPHPGNDMQLLGIQGNKICIVTVVQILL